MAGAAWGGLSTDSDDDSSGRAGAWGSMLVELGSPGECEGASASGHLSIGAWGGLSDSESAMESESNEEAQLQVAAHSGEAGLGDVDGPVAELREDEHGHGMALVCVPEATRARSLSEYLAPIRKATLDTTMGLKPFARPLLSLPPNEEVPDEDPPLPPPLAATDDVEEEFVVGAPMAEGPGVALAIERADSAQRGFGVRYANLAVAVEKAAHLAQALLSHTPPLIVPDKAESGVLDHLFSTKASMASTSAEARSLGCTAWTLRRLRHLVACAVH